FSVERFCSPRMRDRIEGFLRTNSLDLIVADGMYALLNIPDTDIPILLNCHNVAHVIIERFAGLEKNVFKNKYAVQEACWLRDAERRACERVRTAMVCSEYDRYLIQQLRPEMQTFVVPNVVDTDLYTPDLEHIGKRDCMILFQGSMDWYPNRDAV